MGSGFIVHQDGYVVTNAHVVESGIRELLAERVTKESLELTLESLKGRFPELKRLNQGEQNIVKQVLRLAYVEYCTKHGRFEGVRQVKVLLRKSSSGEAAKGEEIPAKVLAVGTALPGKDVAILKMQGANFPTLALGDESAVDVGDEIVVIGFPGAAFLRGIEAESSLLEASMTSGIVSAKKRTRGGWTLLQTDAAVSPGNSGGPVSDLYGRVVGIATGTGLDPGTRQRAEGVHFVVPSSIIKQFLTKLNVKWRTGP
jgi:serine protease Do